MLDDIAAAMKRREHIDEPEQLHFEVLVSHRERHHPLIKASFTEERFRMAIDQLENAFAASLNFGLQSAHSQKLIARQSQVKRTNFERNKKNHARIRSLRGSIPKRGVT
jgi:hypothetical protein